MAPPAPADVIADDAQAGCAFTGSWSTYSGPGYPFYGTGFHYDDPGDGSERATFTPGLPRAGRYEVFTWWGTSQVGASNAPYTIVHAGGATTVRVNLRGPDGGGGAWHSLGTYEFAAGSAGRVVLSDDADGYVIADALRFVEVAPPATPPPTQPAPAPTPGKRVSQAAAGYGDVLTYTITLAGSGGTLALVDRLPDGLELDPASLTCHPHDLGTLSTTPGEVRWSGSLADGESVELSYCAEVQAGAPAVLVNRAVVQDALRGTTTLQAVTVVNGHAVYLPVVLRGSSGNWIIPYLSGDEAP